MGPLNLRPSRPEANPPTQPPTRKGSERLKSGFSESAANELEGTFRAEKPARAPARSRSWDIIKPARVRPRAPARSRSWDIIPRTSSLNSGYCLEFSSWGMQLTRNANPVNAYTATIYGMHRTRAPPRAPATNQTKKICAPSKLLLGAL